MANPFLDPPSRAYDWAEGNPIGTSRVEMVRSADGQPFDPLARFGFGDKPRTQGDMARLFDDGMTTAGAVGSLGGQFSRVANLRKAMEAEIMLARGALPQEVLLKTGWWKNPQGEMKFEIPDNNMLLRVDDMASTRSLRATPNLSEVTSENLIGQRLSDVVQHDELFKHYPALRDVHVGRDVEGNAAANWNSAKHTINLAPGWTPTSEMARLLGHEITHATQSFEGWQNGSAPISHVGKNYKEIVLERNKVRDKFIETAGKQGIGLNTREDLLALSKALADGALSPKDPHFLRFSSFMAEHPEIGQHLLEAGKHTSTIQRMSADAHKAYKSVTGEADARAVERRLDLSSKARELKPFWEDYDVSPRNQIGSKVLPWNGGRP